VQTRQSSVTDFADMAAMLPWQIGGLLALLTYWFLRDMPSWMPVSNGGDSTLASFPQYVIPSLLMVVALLSFIRARQRDALILDSERSPVADPLSHMSFPELEKRVADAFRREGHRVVACRGKQHLDCVDLELFMGRDRYLVQCRRWKEPAIDARAVRELFVAICAERAVGGFIVASGKFTDEARKMAMGRSIRIVPADSLRDQVSKRLAFGSEEGATLPESSLRSDDQAPPACPKCGKVMMPRTKRQDESLVQVDWCCTRFPACQGSRNC